MKKLVLAAVGLLVMVVAGILFLSLKYGDDEWEKMDYWRGY